MGRSLTRHIRYLSASRQSFTSGGRDAERDTGMAGGLVQVNVVGAVRRVVIACGVLRWL